MLLLPFEPQSHLAGPPPPPGATDGVDLGAITGGRMVAVLEAERGVRSLWRGREGLLRDGLELTQGESVLRGDRLRLGPGSWERRIPLPDGRLLIERGLLPDVGGALVIEWELPSSPPSSSREAHPPDFLISLRLIGGTDDRSQITLTLSSTTPASVLILSDTEVPERTVQLLRALAGREGQRANRSRAGEAGSLRILSGGAMVPAVVSSLNAIDESALLKGDGGMEPLFLGGIAGGVPQYLEGAKLAELGVAALLAGRRSQARGVLEALAVEADPPSLPLIHLAGRWAHWTGDPRPLLPLKAALDDAAHSLSSSPHSASLPQPSKALREFIEGIEPLGDEGWNRSLKKELERLDAPPSSSRRISLPVLGRSEAGSIVDQESFTPDIGAFAPNPQLPSPDTFASPDHPGVLAWRTTQGARILRSWIEGQLGARPDAGFARLRIAPTIHSEWEGMEASGVSVGDALFSVLYRKEEDGCEFALRQDGGKIPVNLIFEPILPWNQVMGVWIDGEPAEVDLEAEEGGTRLRFQLPLDRERRIRITGVTSETASSPF